tara:strand:- start:348 stop:569 length:222 start_codon:yes stop_codon:yes gene_type:complete
MGAANLMSESRFDSHGESSFDSAGAFGESACWTTVMTEHCWGNPAQWLTDFNRCARIMAEIVSFVQQPGGIGT